ncbi:MAG: tRNA pseudouridine(54/55) synthase Pus10 [Methanomassiliicoccales archaeon]
MREEAQLTGLCKRCATRIFPTESAGTYTPVSEQKCSICRGLFMRVEDFAAMAVEALRSVDYDTFWIGSRLEFGTAERERQLAGVELEPSRTLKVELNREIGKQVSAMTGKEGSASNADVTVIVDTAFGVCQLEIRPLFVYGKYRKLVRGIPQTRWLCRKCRGAGCGYCNFRGKMYETSVQELIAPPLMEVFQAKDNFFHGMGREDIDAVMLGDGRPFIMELREPGRRHASLVDVEREINRRNEGVVEVSGLSLTTRDAVRKLKTASPGKVYLVRFRTADKVNKELLTQVFEDISNSKISQRTPTRVLHRRADLIRERRIIACRLESYEDGLIAAEVEAEAGTYIKELVTGDSGRTVPSISELLGTDCTVESLDVLRVLEEEEW